MEVHTQNRLSILAACEDPRTISTYNYAGQLWPLPQTGQMWLEYELLAQPNVPGYFCLSTSYRNEPNPVEGRHCLIFPMFEFELHGGMPALKKLEEELLEYLGFGSPESFASGNYTDMAKMYETKEITRLEEARIGDEINPVFFLEYFPDYSNPFWNMKRNEDNPKLANKIDVLLHGVETIGSAERSCDTAAMRDIFYSIEGGQYSQKLFDLFGKARVIAELDEFLGFDFFPRSGGGIGVTRLIRAMQLQGIAL